MYTFSRTRTKINTTNGLTILHDAKLHNPRQVADQPLPATSFAIRRTYETEVWHAPSNVTHMLRNVRGLCVGFTGNLTGGVVLRERKGEWKVCFDLVGLGFWVGV